MTTTLTPKTFAELLTASGGANGTVVDVAGNIVGMSAPAFDYHPVTHEPIGLRLRGTARTNLIKHSSDLTQAAWAIGGSSPTTINANAYLAPDGSMTGDELIRGGTANGSISQTFEPVTINSIYSFVFRIRAGTWTTAAFGLHTGDWAVQTGTILSGPGVIDNAAALKTISGLTSEWTTVLLKTSAAVAAGAALRFYLYPEVYNAGTAGRSIGLWGFEAYAGDHSTTYIATGAASVTRTPDRVTIGNLQLQPWWNPAEGTILVDFSVAALSPALLQYPGVVRILGGSNSIQMFQTPTQKIGVRFDVGGVNTWNTEIAAFTLDVPLRGVISWKEGRQLARINETVLSRAQAGPVLSANVELRLGQVATDAFDGRIRQITYWPKAANATEIANLSPDTERIVG
ncbi:phage head spike fiber domain-containing protein [Variovorax paradoxus]|uniref:Uncharacterized protein n=1 Tax=Variovorax paradoxus TaxID=34073 RepID=A0A0H2M643_VARPD|nr:hypothetical protein [Variovorax paradoxus]KLN57611.1 hypothetical protein VPARA_11240 [Variovorax paradoxus]